MKADFNTIVSAADHYYSGADQWAASTSGGVSYSDLEKSTAVTITKTQSGKVVGYDLKDYFSAVAPGHNIDSNAAPLIALSAIPASMAGAGGAVTAVSGAELVSGLGSVALIAGKILLPVALVGAVIALGKRISDEAYAENPNLFSKQDFADKLEAFGDVLSDKVLSDAPNSVRALFGVDTSNGEIQAYIPQALVGEAGYYLNKIGSVSSLPHFQCSQELLNAHSRLAREYEKYAIPYNFVMDCIEGDFTAISSSGDRYSLRITNHSAPVYIACYYQHYSGITNYQYLVWAAYSYDSFNVTTKKNGETLVEDSSYRYQYTDAGTQVYTASAAFDAGQQMSAPWLELPIEAQVIYQSNEYNSFALFLRHLFAYGGFEIGSSGLSGITDEPGATQVPIADTDTPADILDTISGTLGGLWDQRVVVPTLQPDGTLDNDIYFPVALPVPGVRGEDWPITGDLTQLNTAAKENSDSATKEQTIAAVAEDELNPPPTGTGVTPSITLPSGSSGGMWSVYSPSQSQLNTFGSWLWSSDFVDQLKKLFNDPMQSIIGLHKVFCSVPTSGTANIRVGYLDSGCSASVVSGQYTTVDCGSVSLGEYFGNVFDYSPFTDVRIYLPFVGIVPLDVADVMRATIGVKYRCDVLTGACLAEVSVKRDAGAGGVLYQFAGNCAVQYPLSAGSYMGVVSGALSAIGGVVGTIASGGALAPLALGAASSAMNLHTNVQRSGSLSGNAGALGGKKPYLIISRPQTALADHFENLNGKPSNEYRALGSHSGFVRVQSVHVEGIPATTAEMEEIETLLKGGVIV